MSSASRGGGQGWTATFAAVDDMFNKAPKAKAQNDAQHELELE